MSFFNFVITENRKVIPLIHFILLAIFLYIKQLILIMYVHVFTCQNYFLNGCFRYNI